MRNMINRFDSKIDQKIKKRRRLLLCCSTGSCGPSK
jgi:hypothetical protein